MASKSWTSFLKYIWPPSVISGVLKLLGEWSRSSVKTKTILAVFFIPAMLSVGGLIVCVAYFILFKLPSFILSVLGWLLLISLFSGGGLFCYERLTGKQAAKRDDDETIDVTPGSDASSDKNPKSWFDDIKWFKKK